MGGPYKLKKRGKPMTTIYDAAILLVDDNPDLLTLVTDNLHTAGYTYWYADWHANTCSG